MTPLNPSFCPFVEMVSLNKTKAHFSYKKRLVYLDFTGGVFEQID